MPQETVVIGLVATPPDFPARIAERITEELADLLSQHVDGDTTWKVRTGWGDIAPRRDGGAEALLDDMAQRAAAEGWDLAVCLTDLPFQRDRRPVVALCSGRRRAALISLPALGFGHKKKENKIFLYLLNVIYSAIMAKFLS